MQKAFRGWGLIAVVLGAAAAGVAGCGGDGGTDMTGSFVGSWQYVSGMSTITCPPLPPMNSDLAGMVPIARGTGDAALEAAKPLGDGGQTCTIKLGVAGSTATAMPNQTCSVTLMSVPAMLKIDSYTFSVTGDMLSETGMGSGSGMWNGLTFNCTYTSTGQLKKAP